MNKVIKSISAILFVGIVLVGVLVISTNKLYAYVDFDAYDYKLVTIENGWNLVPADLGFNNFNNNDWEITSFWYLNPINKEYVDIINANNSEEFDRQIDRLSKWLGSINAGSYAHEVSVPGWFYKEDNLEILPDYERFTDKLFKVFRLFDFSDTSISPLIVHLYKGWNLLVTNPIILDYPLEDYIGGCDNKLSSIYYFNSSKQNWDKLRINSDGILKNNGRDLPLGGGIALKVSKDCKFDYASIGSKQRTVPSLPNN